MSTRVYFYRGARNGALDVFLSAPLNDFRQWYASELHDEDYIAETEWAKRRAVAEGDHASLQHLEVISDPSLLSTLDHIIEKGAQGLIPTSFHEARLIDVITDMFYSWSSLERPDLLNEELGGTFSVSRYRSVEPKIGKYLGAEAARLWNYLLNGRPIGRSESLFPYIASDAGFSKGYWTADEARFLYQKLESRQGTLLRWRTFFWEDAVSIETAKEALEKVVAGDTGLLIDLS